MNGAAYWEKRYTDEEFSEGASWPDAGARFLELEFMRRNLPIAPASVLEVGCGPFTINDGRDLAGWIDSTHYHGIDGSEAAIGVARSRAMNAGLMSATFHAQDFEVHRELPRAEFVLCRRLLCNLSRDVRKDLIWQFSRFPHGLVIEPTKRGLAELNTVRAHKLLPPIPEAEHNDYLEDGEVDMLKNRMSFAEHPCLEIRFMSPYYARTRAVEFLGAIDQQWRYEQAMLARKEAPGLLGPVVGFTW